MIKYTWWGYVHACWVLVSLKQWLTFPNQGLKPLQGFRRPGADWQQHWIASHGVIPVAWLCGLLAADHKPSGQCVPNLAWKPALGTCNSSVCSAGTQIAPALLVPAIPMRFGCLQFRCMQFQAPSEHKNANHAFTTIPSENTFVLQAEWATCTITTMAFSEKQLRWMFLATSIRNQEKVYEQWILTEITWTCLLSRLPLPSR